MPSTRKRAGTSPKRNWSISPWRSWPLTGGTGWPSASAPSPVVISRRLLTPDPGLGVLEPGRAPGYSCEQSLVSELVQRLTDSVGLFVCLIEHYEFLRSGN